MTAAQVECVRASGLQVAFQGVKALGGVDIELTRGEIVGLIGPNGAGKTTLVNVLSGYQTPAEGRIHIDGRDVTKLSPHRRARLGLVRTFQAVRLFSGLSVLDNIELGVLSRGLGRRAAKAEAMELLESVGLADRANDLADSVPYGAERRLGILRVLATRPKYLLIDEPAAGLNDSETDDLIATLQRLPERFGVGILVIEHDMKLIMRVCDRIHVLDYGKTIAEGTPEEVRNDPDVQRAYYGSSVEAT
ncbi:ABC transporter ATP-binding protein [Planotetraspora sp. GP83]|uniref:ABC transporter ATP-binding protein n=1 Tax=Planotetraspora sp. GP83 TaxID=3156264 RepID=UPI003515CE9E